MTLLSQWTPASPFRFALLLDFLSRFAHPTLDAVQANAYWRILRDGQTLALVLVHETSADPGSTRLQAEVMASSGSVDPAVILSGLRTVLPPTTDDDAFFAHARQYEALWQVVEPLVGMPTLRSASLFESLMQAIIEQQISWVAAQRAQRWLVEWAGNRLDYDGRAYYAFPTPAQLAAATIDDLKPTRITFKRMALLIDLSAQITSGAFDLEALLQLPHPEAYRELLRHKGIGHWTAAVALNRACGYYDIHHNDVALQAATNRYFYGAAGRISPEQVIATYSRYTPYAGVAAHYTLLRWVFDQYPQSSASGLTVMI